MALKLIYTSLLSLIILSSCKKELPPAKVNTLYHEVITADDRNVITTQEAKTYHVESRQQYEYRTGKPGQYEYNYDVRGVTITGDSVYGNINTEGKFGAGILNNDSLPVTEIKTEWVSYGKLRAIDQKGNEYLLKVD